MKHTPSKPDYTHTYWSHEGKHEALIAELNKVVPSSGEVENADDNPALERFRVASNCYYDLYNNGLGNRGKEFETVFGFSAFDVGEDCDGFSVELSQELIDRTESTMDKIILAAYREQFPTLPMPWCQHCQCYHHATAECIKKHATIPTMPAEDIRVGQVLRSGDTVWDLYRDAEDNVNLLLNDAKLRSHRVTYPKGYPVPVAETIDITPRGCQTPEGNERVNRAMATVDSANARVADIATQMVDRLSANRQWDSEENDTLKAAIQYRKDAYTALLRAVAGR